MGFYSRLLFFILLISSVTALFSLESERSTFYTESIFPTGGMITGQAAVSGGNILLFSEDRYLYIFDSSGLFVSRVRIPEKPHSFQTSGSDGIIYKYFSSGSFGAFNSRGQILWSAVNNSPPFCPPVINSFGNIFTAAKDGMIKSYSYLGRKRWELDTSRLSVNADKAEQYSEGKLSAGLCAGDLQGEIYAGFSDGVISVISDSGRIIKRHAVSDNIITAISADSKGIYVSDSGGNLLLLDSGLNLISSARLESAASSIRAGKQLTAVVMKNGSACVFDKNLALISRQGSSRSITGAPAVSGSLAWFLSRNGFIVRFDSQNAEYEDLKIPYQAVSGMRSRVSGAITGGGSSAYISISDKLLIAGGLDWNIYFSRDDGILLPSESQYAAVVFDNMEADAAELPDNRYLIYVNELSLSEDAGNREKALALIGEMLSETLTGRDERYAVSILKRIAASGLRSGRSIQGGSNAVIRSRAVELLGKVGTRETAALLRKILHGETDPFTAAAAVKQLGRAGSDPDGRSIRLFASTWSRFPGDIRIAESIISALKDITAYHGYLPSSEGRTLLFKMLEMNGNHELKFKIADILRNTG